MKKTAAVIIFAVLLLVITIFGILFTQPGNNIMKPMIESRINANLNQKIKLETFSLRPSTFKIKLNLGNGSYISSKGTYGLFSKTIDAKYDIKIAKLENISPLIKMKLQGPFSTNGYIKGSKHLLNISGISDVASSKTDYHLTMRKFKLTSINMSIKNAKLEKILYMLKYPRIFSSIMNSNISYNLKTKKGVMNTHLINGHILPNKMTFLLHNMARFDITKEIYNKTDIISHINNNIITSDLDMRSRLTHITSKNAVVDMKGEKVDAKLKIDIKKEPVYVKIKGNIKHPKIKLDIKELFMKKIQKKVNKLVPKNLQDIINKFQ